MSWSIVVGLEGDPIPKGRPRLGRGGHVYTPARTRDWEQMWREMISLKLPSWFETTAEEVAVTLRFWTKASTRGDADNLSKTVLDAANGLIWKDDRQVRHLDALIVERGSREPRTELLVEPFET